MSIRTPFPPRRPYIEWGGGGVIGLRVEGFGFGAVGFRV